MTFKSDQKGQSNNREPENQPGSTIAIWIPIGVGFGVALGLVLNNLALGIGVGAAIGTAVGAAIVQRRKGLEIENYGKKGRLLLAIGMGILLLVGAAILVFLLLK